MFPSPTPSLQLLLDALATDPVAAFGKITAAGEIAALPYLLACTHNPAAAIREPAEQAVAALLPKLNAKQLLELEACMRECSTSHGSCGDNFHAAPLAGWKLSTLAPSGWRREKALLRLVEDGDPAALPFVLLRIGDWVSQVRQLAERWLSLYANSLPSEAIIHSIPILAALKERYRGQSSPFLATLLTTLKSPTAAPRLLKALPDLDSPSRKMVFPLLSESGSLQQPETQRALLSHPDPILGVLLLKNLRSFNAELPETLVAQAISARSALLRRYALYYLSTEQLQEHQAILLKALFDPVQGLRSFAQYHQRKTMSAEELQAIYQTKLENAGSSNALIAASISGFHEAGGKWPAHVYENWLGRSSVQVRVAALRWFSMTHSETVLPFLRWNLTNTRSPGLAKVALSLLQKRPYDLSMSEIQALLDTREPEAIRLRGFALLNRRGKWEQLSVLLGLARDPVPSLQSKAHLHLSRWLGYFNNSQVQPSMKQIEDASMELERSRTAIGERRYLEFQSLLTAVMPKGRT